MNTAQRKTVGDEPLPGYHLVSPLGQGGFGEVWKCKVPGGMYKAVKFVPLETQEKKVPGAAKQELRAFGHIKTLRHPFLLSLERVEVTSSEVIMISELADRSLADRLEECQQLGQKGVPRQELLGYLFETAEALDVLNFQYGLQHLDIKPNNLLLLGEHIKVADFGLVTKYNALSQDANYTLPGHTPLYSPPELLRGSISPHSDQYSLAIVYQELLTGVLPFQGKNRQALTVMHLGAEPDLTSLSERDQTIVRKALSKNPEDRYSSCTDFVTALLGHTRDESRKPTRAFSRSTILRRLNRDKQDTNDEEGQETTIKFQETNAKWQATDEERAPGEGKEHSLESDPLERTTDPDMTIRETQLYGVEEFLAQANLKPMEQLSQDCLGELWKVQTTEGELCLARWLNSQLVEASEKDAIGLLNFLGTLYHPALPQWDLVRIQTGQWMLATEINQRSLWDHFRKYFTKNKQGIPREELLNYMLQLSTFLDAFAARGIHHYCLNPRTILLSSDHLVLLDFGLIHHLWQSKDWPAQLVNPHYAPPEMRAGEFHPKSDQYTLALLFVELVTGSYPRGLSKRAARDVDCDRNLALVGSSDEKVIRRALHKNPEKRFASCSDFVHALAQDGRLRKPSKTSIFPEVILVEDLYQEAPPSPGRSSAANQSGTNEFPRMVPQQFLTQLLVQEVGPFIVRNSGAVHYLEYSEQKLDCCLPVRALGDVFQLKLKTFANEYQASFHKQDGVYVMWLPFQGTFWQRFWRTSPGLEFRVEYQPPTRIHSNLSQARVQIEIKGGAKAPLTEELRTAALKMLNRFRSHVQDAPDHRKQMRLPFQQQVMIYPILSKTEWGERILGETKDVSTGGIGLILPAPTNAKYVYIHFPRAQSVDGLAVLGRVVREEPVSEGCEVGVRVAPADATTPIKTQEPTSKSL